MYDLNAAFARPVNHGLGGEGIRARPFLTNTEELQTHVVVVNSADRDVATSPSCSDYVVTMPSIIRDVVSIELINGSIPRSQYNINASNNLLVFEEHAGAALSAAVPVGQYGAIADLCAAVAAAATRASTAGVTYSMTASALTSSVTLAGSGGTASLLTLHTTAPRSIFKLLGFGALPALVTSAFSGAPPAAALTAPGIYKLSGEDYTTLTIDDFPLLESTNNVIQNGFCVIHFGDMHWSAVKHLKMSDNGSKMIRHNNPIKDLSRLHIRFVRSDGTLYDFNGQENTLVFEVKAKFQKRQYD
jgi:hypothetical protein